MLCYIDYIYLHQTMLSAAVVPELLSDIEFLSWHVTTSSMSLLVLLRLKHLEAIDIEAPDCIPPHSDDSS